MAVVATNLRKGQCIEYKGERGMVLHTEHRTPGKGNALVMATIRSFQSGKTKDIRFSSDERVDVLNADRQNLEYSFQDQGGYHFMDPNTYETVALRAELLEGYTDLLMENMKVEVLFLEGTPISVEMPASVDLKVTSAPEGLKGDTANNPYKAVTLETGKEIQAPLFIKEGDTVRVNTETGKYMSRV